MRTESSTKPSRFIIEALPPKEGKPCIVWLADNIKEVTRPAAGPEDHDQTIYVFDQYAVDTSFRDSLEADVEKSFDAWLEQARAAEAAGKRPTELEILQATVEQQQAKIDGMDETISDLLVSSLGGDV